MLKRVMRIAAAAAVAFSAGCTDTDTTTWRFDRLDLIGGVAAHPEGHPQLITTPAGTAIAFNGVDDALFVDKHPMAGASTFTVEAVFRPDGGAFEQRWLHLAETDPVTGQDTGSRFLFEIRVEGDHWYLDSFCHGPGYHMPLMFADKPHPLGRWYRAAMTFDGKIFRSYVDGVEQGEAPVDFKPQGPGHSSFGARINRVNYFHGAIYEARFTPRALAPDEFAPLPPDLNP